MKKIKDLITVSAVKTVIQLKDAQDARLRNILLENFLITDEVGLIFKTLFKSLYQQKGQGFFIEGNFGSGKSHLLSVLSLLLREQNAWKPLISQSQQLKKSLATYQKVCQDKKYLLVELSLVEHSNKEYLEDIVVNQMEKGLAAKGQSLTSFHQQGEFVASIQKIVESSEATKLKSFLREKQLDSAQLFSIANIDLIEELLTRLNLPYRLRYNRREIFAELSSILNQGLYQGVIILIDELSEFLRSKEDSRRFNEDIRFLQFLGEFSQNNNLWILATLQEEIEKTGETTPEAFNKIKDRYPVRFRLTAEHIKELVKGRLIKPQPNAVEQIQAIYQFYKNSFKSLNLTAEEFRELYPIHPVTIELLENMKPLFSQHRGIIDFIHYRLQGDSARNIKSFLEENADQLITPELIFDHFEERIREMTETVPYYERVYRYYQQEIKNILAPEDQAIGLSLIKLLILFKISPLEKKYTVEDMANMLLYQVTDLDTTINYQNIAQILATLAQSGAYLKSDQDKSYYFIDLEADTNLLIQRKLNYIKKTVFADDHRLFTRLARFCNQRSLPLKDLLDNRESIREISWQNTSRKGYLNLINFKDLTVDLIEDLSQKLAEQEEDFVIFMGELRDLESAKNYLKDIILPEIPLNLLDALIFWIPKPPENDEFLLQILAKTILYDEYRTDDSKLALEIKNYLKEQLKEDQASLINYFVKCYFQGELINASGEKIAPLENLTYLQWESIIEKISANVLNKRFPKHINISPFYSHFSPLQLAMVVEKFFANSSISAAEAKMANLTKPLENLIKPLGVIKKKKDEYILNVQPEKNPLIKELFKELNLAKEPVHKVYLKMRKGPYGLIRDQFNILVAALFYAGYLSLFTSKQKVTPANFSYSRLSNIKYIGVGEIIREEFQEVLMDCVLFPVKMVNQPFSLPLQGEMWSYLKEIKNEYLRDLASIKLKAEEMKKQQLFDFELKTVNKVIINLENIFDEVKVSYSAEEGLERFASFYRNSPHLQISLKRFKQIKHFFTVTWDNFRQMKKYLNHSQLKIPAAADYKELNQLQQELKIALATENIIYEQDLFEAQIKSFDYFLQTYRAQYEKEHHQQLNTQRFAPYQQQKKTISYSILQSFSRLMLISVSNNISKVDRLLNQGLAQICHDFNPAELETNPSCSCGFLLGQKIELPSLKAIQKYIDQGILQYLQQLKQKEYSEPLREYIESMEKAGEKKFARPLKELLSLQLDDSELLTKLNKIINRNLIERINQGLTKEYSLQHRDIDQLYDQLTGRTFTAEQLYKTFQQWVEGTGIVAKNTYLRIDSPRLKGQEKASDLLSEFIENNYPELLNYYQQSKEDFLSYLLYFNFKLNHQCSLEELLQNRLNVMEDDLLFEKSFFDLIQNLPKDPLTLKFVQSELDNYIASNNLGPNLLNYLEENNEKAILKALQKEKLSLYLMKELIIKIIKRSGIVESDFLAIVISLTSSDDNKSELFDLLKHFFLLQEGLEKFSNQKESQKLSSFEQLQKNHPLEYYLSKIEELSEKQELRDYLPLNSLTDAVKKSILKKDQEFDLLYKKTDFASLQGLNKPITEIGNLLNKKYPQLCNKVKATQNTIILLDGMRYDVWYLLWKQLKKTGSFRIVEAGSLLAHFPTDTATQLQVIDSLEKPYHIINYKSWEGPKIKADEIIKLDYIDEKVHTSKQDYHLLLQEIVFQSQSTLGPLLDKIPQASGVLILSDHGFKINYSFTADFKYEQERYSHGGISLAEVIVPWAFLYKI